MLVEGGEVYLIPSLVDKVKGNKQVLDYENITVARVNGKGNFLIYIKMLQCFNIPYIILGDLDCFKDEINKILVHFNITEINDNISAIKQAMVTLPTDYNGIQERIKNIDKNFDAQKLQEFLEKVMKKEIEADCEELLDLIRYMQSRHIKGDKELAILNAVGKDKYEDTLSKLRDYNIFIWKKGELENYYTERSNSLSASKDLKALELSYLLQMKTEKIEDFLLHMEEVELLVNYILEK